jgi:sulfatase maturation enzyme AslB (radical SAM superfamily)
MWCPLPWTHLGVKNNGDLRMCSHSQSAGTGTTLLCNDSVPLTITDLSTVDVMNCDTLKNVRRDMLKGKWPAQCKRCKDESLASINSRDQWETERHKDSFTKEIALSITDPDGSVSGCMWQDFDLRIGNECNLRCTMCFAGESSKWFDVHEEILGWDYFVVDGKKYDLTTSKNLFGWSKIRDNIDALIANSNGLLKINFGGGEPLLIKHHRYLLESLIKSNRASSMELEYSSNLTFFPPDLFDMWKHFKNIRICGSIDAVGLANDAIRYHSKWNTVVDNLRMLDETDDNINVFLSTTISILSLEHYGTLLSWIADQNYKKIKDTVSHLVYNPKYFNIGLLDRSQLLRTIQATKLTVAQQPKLLKKIDRYQSMYDQIKMTANEITEQRFYFLRAWDNLQKNQKQDWTEIFPMAAMVAEEWRTSHNV